MQLSLLPADVLESGNPIRLYKDALSGASKALDARFCEGADVRELVWMRAAVVDAVLSQAWERLDWPQSPAACLIAVGGYGRGELHPQSDIDLLILLEREDPLPIPELARL